MFWSLMIATLWVEHFKPQQTNLNDSKHLSSYVLTKEKDGQDHGFSLYISDRTDEFILSKVKHLPH